MLILALGFGVITGLANILGSYIAIVKLGDGNRGDARRFLGLSGGFLLGAALLEVLPESLEGGIWMPSFVAMGYLVMYVAEQVFAFTAHDGHKATNLNSSGRSSADHTLVGEFRHAALPITLAGSLAALVGFNIHDFIDGLAIGSGMLTSEKLGVLMFFVVLIHEIPAGFAIGSIMVAAGRGKKAGLLAGASIGIATLIGIVVPFLLNDLTSNASYAFLALSSGTFIYIAASDLIPAAGEVRSRGAIFFVLIGFGVFVLSKFALDLAMG